MGTETSSIGKVNAMMIDTHSSPVYASARRGRLDLLSLLAALTALFRARQTLAGMDARMLDDIGVAPEAARKEASRPFWDVPAHWMR